MTTAMRYSDVELENLLTDVESDQVERKEAWKGDAPEKARQAICAFANDLPDHRTAGVLFVGAKDSGAPSGLAIDDRLLLTLADIKTDGKIIPPPTVTVEKRLLKGAEMAVVTVQPADAPPVRCDGRIWIRLGPRRGIATIQDERILNEKRRFRDFPFDVQPVPSSNLNALSRLLFEEEYLPNAVARDTLAANERTYEQRLAACRIVATADDPTPTVLGLLVLGKMPRDWLPGAYVQFLRIQGTAWSDPVTDESVIDGPLAQIIRRLDDKLDAHNTVGVDISSQSTETRSYAYPRVALQQLTRNAIMHRSYESTNAPVRLYWFDDRIEIHNPGGPFGAVTAENFGKPGVTDYRNPHLAEAMKVLGFVQRFGVGIATAQAELRKNGNPEAEFTVQPSAVLALVRRKPMLTPYPTQIDAEDWRVVLNFLDGMKIDNKPQLVNAAHVGHACVGFALGQLELESRVVQNVSGPRVSREEAIKAIRQLAEGKEMPNGAAAAPVWRAILILILELETQILEELRTDWDK